MAASDCKLKLAVGLCSVLLVLGTYGPAAAVPGDVDSSGAVDLRDAILFLKVLTGPTAPVFTPAGDADVNDDGVLGSEEALFALNVVAGARPSPYVDVDGDGVSVGLGDCDDGDAAIYPLAPDSCGDGVDQNCDSQDSVCPAAATLAEEDFATTAGGFSWSFVVEVSNGRLLSHGYQPPQTPHHIVTWRGGGSSSPHNYPSSSHSNYFDNFHVSVDVFWDGGDPYTPNGLAVNSGLRDGDTSWIEFLIASDGGYYILEQLGQTRYYVTSPARSFLRASEGQPNTLAIEKEGDSHRFYLNGTEVERLILEGYAGGGVGLTLEKYADVSFDNFRITEPLKPRPEGMEFPHVTTADLNDYVYKVMTSSYYWYKEVPQVDPAAYPSPEALLDAMMYKELDEYSYIWTAQGVSDYFQEGKIVGFGADWDYDIHDDLRISYVYPDSPAAVAGLVRGDRILEIAGHTTTGTDEDELYGLLEEAIVEAGFEGEIDFKIQNAAGTVRDVQLALTWVTIEPVLHHEIIEHGGKRIGYLVLDSFIEPAIADLEAVIRDFSLQGINGLILDLRYNGGGMGGIANGLSSAIGGANVADELFCHYQHNDKYSDWDVYDYFAEQTYTLNLNGVVIITTSWTCSASEYVINALSPHINVATIGSTTCGKPVGMYGYAFHGRYIMPIEFRAVNSQDQGDYFDGIPPTCDATDDLSLDFGDIEEDSLAEALNYIANGSCRPGRGGQSIRPKRTFPKKGFRRQIGVF